jgi:hypothetical protein
VISLDEAMTIVRTELAAAEAACGSFLDDPGGWHKRHRARMDELATLLSDRVGAAVDQRWDGARVRIGRVSATSTSGLAGALRNWLAAAEKRMAKL